MLSQLTINNFAIVDHLDIELHPGMTVITGETGAGKSIMLDALGLTLGDRADKEVVRAGGKRADISACFSLDDNRQALQWLDTNDLAEDDSGTCILRRVVTAEGRSRAYINGQAVTLNELRALGDMLVDIHSQHEHQSLLKTTTHQRLLDEYCGCQEQLRDVARLASQWQQLSTRLQEITNNAEEADARFQLLSYQFQELEQLALQENELQALEREHTQLSNAEATLSQLQQSLDMLTDNDEQNIRQHLSAVMGLLETPSASSEHVAEALNMLNNALIQVEEGASELQRAASQFEPDPQRLQEVDARLSSIHELARKHRVHPSELHALCAQLGEELSELNPSDELIQTLQQEINAIRQKYDKQAAALSKLRSKGAKKLEQEVNSQLNKLGMSAARFELALNSRKDSQPASYGNEKIEFLISTNAGQASKALNRIASGGELSRISLAIQVVTAQTSSIPSLVFDEVDVGIGGGVAKSVGELLRQLGEKGQVLCVTHQPQVASQGHQHLYVSKLSDGKTTATTITSLDDEARIREVARMLGGEEPSDNSLAHAREMMA